MKERKKQIEEVKQAKNKAEEVDPKILAYQQKV